MKKREKKLVLSKETVKNLEQGDLDFVMGAALTTGQVSNCLAREKASCDC
jgi:hypothetical protein